MAHSGLSEFLEALDRDKQLARVKAEVALDGEIAEITHRVARADNRALLFPRIAEHSWPVATNLLASERRICLALGIESPAAIADRLAAALRPAKAESLLDKLGFKGLTPAGVTPKRVKSGPCQQVVKLGSDIDLAGYPFARQLPDQQFATVAGGLVVSRHPESGARAVESHLVQTLGTTRLAIHWGAESQLACALAAAACRGEALPLAVVLGGDPAHRLAAEWPMRGDADALTWSGLLRGRAVELVRCRNLELEVPADAEFVFEGEIAPQNALVECGPLIAPNGYRLAGRQAHAVELVAITHRASPVFAHQVLGPAAVEPVAVRQALARMALPWAQARVPDLVDFAFPAWGSAGECAVLAICKRYAGQAQRTASAFWGLEAWMRTRLIVVVDAEVDLQRPDEVWRAAAPRLDTRRDLFFHQGPIDWFDPAPAAPHLGIDATKKLPGETAADTPLPCEAEEAIRGRVTARWGELGLGPDPGER